MNHFFRHWEHWELALCNKKYFNHFRHDFPAVGSISKIPLFLPIYSIIGQFGYANLKKNPDGIDYRTRMIWYKAVTKT